MPNCEKELVFQRNHGPVALAERGYALKADFWLVDYHYRTKAVHGMTVFRQIPLPAFSRLLIFQVVGRRTQWLREPGASYGNQ